MSFSHISFMFQEVVDGEYIHDLLYDIMDLGHGEYPAIHWDVPEYLHLIEFGKNQTMHRQNILAIKEKVAEIVGKYIESNRDLKFTIKKEPVFNESSTIAFIELEFPKGLIEKIQDELIHAIREIKIPLAPSATAEEKAKAESEQGRLQNNLRNILQNCKKSENAKRMMIVKHPGNYKLPNSDLKAPFPFSEKEKQIIRQVVNTLAEKSLSEAYSFATNDLRWYVQQRQGVGGSKTLRIETKEGRIGGDIQKLNPAKGQVDNKGGNESKKTNEEVEADIDAVHHPKNGNSSGDDDPESITRPVGTPIESPNLSDTEDESTLNRKGVEGNQSGGQSASQSKDQKSRQEAVQQARARGLSIAFIRESERMRKENLLLRQSLERSRTPFAGAKTPRTRRPSVNSNGLGLSLDTNPLVSGSGSGSAQGNGLAGGEGSAHGNHSAQSDSGAQVSTPRVRRPSFIRRPSNAESLAPEHNDNEDALSQIGREVRQQMSTGFYQQQLANNQHELRESQDRIEILSSELLNARQLADRLKHENEELRTRVETQQRLSATQQGQLTQLLREVTTQQNQIKSMNVVIGLLRSQLPNQTQPLPQQQRPLQPPQPQQQVSKQTQPLPQQQSSQQPQQIPVVNRQPSVVTTTVVSPVGTTSVGTNSTQPKPPVIAAGTTTGSRSVVAGNIAVQNPTVSSGPVNAKKPVTPVVPKPANLNQPGAIATKPVITNQPGAVATKPANSNNPGAVDTKLVNANQRSGVATKSALVTVQAVISNGLAFGPPVAQVAITAPPVQASNASSGGTLRAGVDVVDRPVLSQFPVAQRQSGQLSVNATSTSSNNALPNTPNTVGISSVDLNRARELLVSLRGKGNAITDEKVNAKTFAEASKLLGENTAQAYQQYLKFKHKREDMVTIKLQMLEKKLPSSSPTGTVITPPAARK